MNHYIIRGRYNTDSSEVRDSVTVLQILLKEKRYVLRCLEPNSFPQTDC